MFADAEEHRQAMDAILDRVNELHSLPQVAVSVLNLTRDSDYDLNEVVACLENDPALAVKILRTVNSSAYGLRRPVSSVQQAVAMLGQRALRLVAMTFSLVDGLTQGTAATLCQDFWRRSIGMAVIASRVARHHKKTDHNDAYAAGLLADLGMLILVQIKADEYIQLAQTTPHGPELIEIERLTFGCSHAELGGQLLQRWGFPDDLVDATRNHHETPDGENSLQTAVHVGYLLSDVLWNAESSQFEEARRLLESEFHFDVDAIIDLMISAKEDVNFNAEMFGVTFDQEIDLDAIRKRATEQHSEAVATISADFTEEAVEIIETPAPEKKRHLGTSVITLFRDTDPMRNGVVAEFDDISASDLVLRLPMPVGTYEQVKIEIRNKVQGFSQDLRGTVRSSEVIDGSRCLVKIELLRRLSSFDLTALDKAGLRDPAIQGSVWM